MKISRNQRILIIDETIRSGKYPGLKKLSRKLDVSEKTAYRDIKYLEEKHKAPIKFCPLNKGYYYTDPDYTVDDVLLSEGEVFGLLLAEKLLSQYENTPYEEKLRSAFMKLQKYVPLNIELENIGAFQRACSFDLGFVRKVDPEVFEFLIKAITEKKQIEIYYYTIYKNERKWRIVDPYHLKNYRGEWYLAAYCNSSSGMRSFSPIRIEEYKFTGKTFSVKDNFSPDDYWANTFGIYKVKEGESSEVSVWIDQVQSRWTNEIIYDGDEKVKDIKRHEDGSMTVTFRGAQEEIKRWIMQYSHRMIVIEPKSLRDEIKKEIEIMKKNYKS